MSSPAIARLEELAAGRIDTWRSVAREAHVSWIGSLEQSIPLDAPALLGPLTAAAVRFRGYRATAAIEAARRRGVVVELVPLWLVLAAWPVGVVSPLLGGEAIGSLVFLPEELRHAPIADGPAWIPSAPLMVSP